MKALETRWLILAVLFLARAVMGFQFQAVASTSPFLIDALGIDYAGIGTLVGLYLLPGVVFALPGGLMGKRYGDARMVAAGLALMAAGGVILGVSGDYGTALLGRALSGAGAVLLNVLLTKMLADWFAGREIVTAMAILLNSWPFGIALGLVAFAPMAEALGWESVMHVTAAAAAGALVILAAFYRPPPAAGSEAAAGPARARLTRHEVLLVSLAGAIWSLFNVALISVISFAPALLQANGLSLAATGLLVSIGTWPALAAVPLGGFLAERTGRPQVVMVGCFVVAGLVIAWIPWAPWPWLAFVLFGLFAWAPAGPIVALPVALLDPARRAAGMGLFFTWYYIGMGLLPAVAGFSRDATGSPAAPLYFAAALMFACIAIFALFRMFGRKARY